MHIYRHIILIYTVFSCGIIRCTILVEHQNVKKYDIFFKKKSIMNNAHFDANETHFDIYIILLLNYFRF